MLLSEHIPVVDNLPCVGEQFDSCVRQSHRVRRSTQKLCLQAGLEIAELPADRRLREPEVPRGSTDAPRVGDSDERLEQGDSIERSANAYNVYLVSH